MSRSSLRSSKARGSSVEAAVIDASPALEPVGDSEATWYDAVTTATIDPDPDRPLLGTPLIETGTPVEIKGACVFRSNGDRDSPGHWFVKRAAHEQLLEASGAYLLTVYAPRPETPILRSVGIPASLLDEHLADRWYEVSADRSESEVAQLSWPVVIDRERVPGALGVSGRAE